ncbi:MAG: agmatine deiminase family protein [candidate division WOR-3 bacterium]|nr:agmatine deiminase family protein [candidate division WOR-3 bacterium]
MTIILCLSLLFNSLDNTFLPKWLTPEEQLRWSQIGAGHKITLPPEGWVETPAEFERVRGVLVTWRYGTYDAIFREIVRYTVQTTKAYIIVRNTSEQNNITNYLTAGGIPLDSVNFITYSNNSIWIRDYGPWFIHKQDNTEGIVDFIYNRPRPLDDSIPWRLGADWRIPVYGSPLRHAGGNFMTDGLGTGFASNLILEENPSFTRRQIDSLMRIYNGLDQFVTVPRINIEYTGHIDLWTKILNDTLIMVGYYAPGHPNHTLLNQNADSLSRCKNREGINYRIVRIPMPYSTSSAPPTYLNSLFVNNKVLVPIWGLAEDDSALSVYQRALPGYQIVGINCSAMSGSGGAIHCITMQVPARNFIHIKHRKLANTSDTVNPYRIRAQIITSTSLIPESCFLYYKINSDTNFNATSFYSVSDTLGVYHGYIPAQSIGDTVYYYIAVKNLQGFKRKSPNHAPTYLYSFMITPNVEIAEEKINYPPRFSVYPNPCYDRAFFSLNLSKPSKIKIAVYNAIGQQVKTLANRTFDRGNYNLQWNLYNKNNQKLSSGAYFIKVTIDQETRLDKLLILK